MRRRVLATLILVGLLWIALPAVVLAGDCPDDRGWYCAKTWMTALPLLAAGAGTLLAALAMSRGLMPPPGETDKERQRRESDRALKRMLKEPPLTPDDFKKAPPKPGKRSGRKDPPSGG
jgi:hypothetical protein